MLRCTTGQVTKKSRAGETVLPACHGQAPRLVPRPAGASLARLACRLQASVTIGCPPRGDRALLQAGMRHSPCCGGRRTTRGPDRKSTRLNSSHSQISYAVFCLKKKKEKYHWSCLGWRLCR